MTQANWRRRLLVWALAMFASTGMALASTSSADPTAADSNFLNEVYRSAHPQVSPQFLMQLGHQTCNVRRAGGSSGDAKVAVSKSLWAQGLNAIGAEVGSLVHAAVDTLCPEVGYP